VQCGFGHADAILGGSVMFGFGHCYERCHSMHQDRTHNTTQSQNMYRTQDTQGTYKEPQSNNNEDMDSKPPARNPHNNFVNLVAQRDEERRQEQQEQQIVDHSCQIKDKIHRF
jgi:hypothetical protein